MSSHKLSQLKADITVDVRGEICPIPLIRTCVALKHLECGQILAVLTDHAPSIDSIQEGAANLGYHVLAIEKMDPQVFRMYVEKPHVGEET